MSRRWRRSTLTCGSRRRLIPPKVRAGSPGTLCAELSASWPAVSQRRIRPRASMVFYVGWWGRGPRQPNWCCHLVSSTRPNGERLLGIRRRFQCFRRRLSAKRPPRQRGGPTDHRLRSEGPDAEAVVAGRGAARARGRTLGTRRAADGASGHIDPADEDIDHRGLRQARRSAQRPGRSPSSLHSVPARAGPERSHRRAAIARSSAGEGRAKQPGVDVTDNGALSTFMAGLEGSLRHALSAAEPGTVGVVSSDAVADEIGRRLAEVTPARSRVILLALRA